MPGVSVHDTVASPWRVPWSLPYNFYLTLHSPKAPLDPMMANFPLSNSGNFGNFNLGNFVTVTLNFILYHH